MHPVVSVIIPAYNTAAYIAQSIESALQQTLQNIEIIVIDDGSTDHTLQVARSFQDHRLKVLENDANQGTTVTTNRGLAVAQGEWVTTLDSDDWMAPNRLERLVEVARSRKADVIVDDLYLVQDGEEQPWSTLLRESDHPITGIQVLDPVFFVETDIYAQRSLHLGLTKPLFRRAFLMQQGICYDTSIKAAFDFWIDMDCLLQGAKFILLPEPYYFYRARAGSAVSSKRVGWLSDCCQATEKFMLRPTVQQNPALMAALTQHLVRFKRYRSYYQVVEPLKQHHYLVALTALFQHPYFFIHLLHHIPGIMQRWVSYHIFKNRTAYSIFPRSRRFSRAPIQLSPSPEQDGMRPDSPPSNLDLNSLAPDTWAKWKQTAPSRQLPYQHSEKYKQNQLKELIDKS
jgi:succinoglycan biosynthesis protein ExoO